MELKELAEHINNEFQEHEIVLPHARFDAGFFQDKVIIDDDEYEYKITITKEAGTWYLRYREDGELLAYMEIEETTSSDEDVNGIQNFVEYYSETHEEEIVEEIAEDIEPKEEIVEETVAETPTETNKEIE